jgi:hypothetical protein
VSLSQLQLDFYPYHLASGDRSAWIRYQQDTSVHTGWLEDSLKHFQTTLLDSVAVCEAAVNTFSNNASGRGGAGHGHAPLSRANVAAQLVRIYFPVH